MDYDPTQALNKLKQLWRLHGEIDQLRVAWQAKVAQASELHKELAAKQRELEEATRPPEPMPLYDREERTEDAAGTPWRERGLGDLQVNMRGMQALEKAGLRTLGDLADFEEREGPLAQSLIEVQGLSGYQAGTVQASLDRIRGTAPSNGHKAAGNGSAAASPAPEGKRHART